MELYRKNVRACDSDADWVWVVGHARDDRTVFGHGVEAMREIKRGAVSGIVEASPTRMRTHRTGKAHCVPAHVRHFECAAICVQMWLRKTHDLAGNPAERRRSHASQALFARIEKHLQAEAHAEKRFLARHFIEHTTQARGIQRRHALRHRGLSGQYHAIGGFNFLHVACNEHALIRRNVHERLRHRAKIAHAVINDRDGFHSANAIKAIKARPWSTPQFLPRAHRARRPCAARGRTP